VWKGDIVGRDYIKVCEFLQISRAIWYISDIGRIYIKGYLYPISYPKIAKKDIPLSFF
jgi:hypothetical protein